jgi:disulfide bond formation protein DsbB
MFNWLTPRKWYFIVVIICAALLGFALYKQHVDYLDPCPLCVFQRVAFFFVGLVALLAAIHNPGRTGQLVYGFILEIGATIGAMIAGRHIWLQSLPPDQVPECGPGLNYMLENFPITEVLSTVLMGSGSCAEVIWSFLGLSMPKWTIIWFIFLGTMTLLVMFRPSARADAGVAPRAN